MKRTVLSLVASLIMASAAWGQDLPEDVLRAAQSGDPEAQLEMGILYEFGFYMEGNNIPALAWYMLAAKQGNDKAVKRRDLLMSRMSQNEIDQARQQSAQLVPR